MSLSTLPTPFRAELQLVLVTGTMSHHHPIREGLFPRFVLLDKRQLLVAGKKSLSLLRLLVPDTDDSASMQLLSIREGLEQFVSMAGFDLAGVPVNPFSATLLPGKPDGPVRQC